MMPPSIHLYQSDPAAAAAAATPDLDFACCFLVGVGLAVFFGALVELGVLVVSVDTSLRDIAQMHRRTNQISCTKPKSSNQTNTNQMCTTGERTSWEI